MTSLGRDWLPGPDGIPFRKAARVVVLDAEGSVLLFHGHDGDDPEHQWWFTPGGGLADGETAREGAARELEEETGIVVPPGELQGPVAHRLAVFEFTNITARQEEDIFLVFTASVRPSVDTSAHTKNERKLVDDWRWFSARELRFVAMEQLVFPPELPDLIDSWRDGWDGSVRHLHEAGGDAR